MKKHVLAAAATLAVGLTLVSPVGSAQAAGSCSVKLGPRLAVDAPYERFDAQLSSDCAGSGVDYASWDIVHPRAGWTNILIFDRTSRDSIDWYAELEDFGTYNVVPSSAYTADYDDVAQRSAQITIKRQSAASMSASRSGRYVTINVTAKYYNESADAYLPWRANKVSLQTLTASGAWKTLAVVKTNDAGKLTYRQTAGKATWRAVVQPASTVWERTTASRTL